MPSLGSPASGGLLNGFSGAGTLISTMQGTGGQSFDLQTAHSWIFADSTSAHNFILYYLNDNEMDIVYPGGYGYALHRQTFCSRTDNYSSLGAHTIKFINAVFSGTVGYSNGTRFIHDIDATGHHSRDVNGVIQAEITVNGVLFPDFTTGGEPANPAEGQQIYDIVLKKMKFWNGTVWAVITSTP